MTQLVVLDANFHQHFVRQVVFDDVSDIHLSLKLVEGLGEV